MVTLDKTLDAAMQLPPEQREMFVDILRKRQIEERRKEISENARKAQEELKAGKLQSRPIEEIIQELHASVDNLEVE